MTLATKIEVALCVGAIISGIAAIAMDEIRHTQHTKPVVNFEEPAWKTTPTAGAFDVVEAIEKENAKIEAQTEALKALTSTMREETAKYSNIVWMLRGTRIETDAEFVDRLWTERYGTNLNK